MHVPLAFVSCKRKCGLHGRAATAKGEVMTDATLIRYRQSIDNIDAALVFMLAERFKVTQAVGRYKAESGLPPADPGREEAQIARLRALAHDADLDPEFSEKFLRFIIDEVIRHHQQAQQAGTASA
jgi:chorismate mutase